VQRKVGWAEAAFLALDYNGNGSLGPADFDLAVRRKVLRARALQATAELLEVQAAARAVRAADAASAADAGAFVDDGLPSALETPKLRAQLSIGCDDASTSDGGSFNRSGSFSSRSSSSSTSDGGGGLSSLAAVSTFEDLDASLASGKVGLDHAVASVAETLALPAGQCLLLLAHHGWDRRAAVEAFVHDDVAARQAAGLPLPGRDPGRDQFTSTLQQGGASAAGAASALGGASGELACGVCFEILDVAAHPPLACGHGFCGECWAGYLAVQVAMRPRGGVACMGAGCRLRVSEETLRRVGVGQPLLDAWRTALARPFLEATSQGLDTSSSSSSGSSGEGGSMATPGGRSGGGGSSGGPRLVHCQSAACSAVIRVPAASSGAQVVCGECLFRFCALCDFPAPHAPATCGQVAAWQAKGGKVEASAEDMANWLAIKQVEEAAARLALLRACLWCGTTQ